MIDIAANYMQQILGSLAIISITICLGSQANGQSSIADLQKLMKTLEAVNTPGKENRKAAKEDRKAAKEDRKAAKAKRTPVKERRTPVKAAPVTTNSGKLKVPKFGVEATERTPVRTFAAPVETIDYSEEVTAKALSTLKRYDRDKNLFLDEVELASGRWNPSALTSDKNGDGRLSLAELQDRYHQRESEKRKQREAYMERRGDGDRGGGRGRGGMSGRERQAFSPSWRETSNDRTNGKQEKGGSSDDRSRSSSKSLDQARSSYESLRRSGSRRTSGSRTSTNGSRNSKSRSSSRVSSAFTKLDSNSDRLVQMHEFSETWPKKKLDEFLDKDANGDGVISPDEW